jgi:exosortase/archaeosortase family protein
LLVAGHNMLLLNYDCLGFGVMSFFSAFVIAYPKPLLKKTIFLIGGLIVIQSLNVLRLTLLALYWKKTNGYFDHHTIFNITIYILIAISLYFWIKTGNKQNNAPN